VRLFVAIELPDDLRVRLSEMQRALGCESLPVRWVRPEGIHLTLKFLGEVPQDSIDAIGSALARAAMHHAPFRLEGRGIGTFPERGRPRVIWVGLLGDVERIVALARSVEEALAPLGFPPEARRFSPHLTLGRFRGSPHADWRLLLERSSGAPFGSFGVDGFSLFESRLKPEGAEYHALTRFRLGERGEA
jgi:2'-5' RNA ligase